MSSRCKQSDLDRLARLDVGRVAGDQPLASHSSWGIGGPADLLIEPQSPHQLQILIRYVAEKQLPLVVIGQGTNLLFDDAGVRGAVVKIGPALGGIQIDGTVIRAGAGVWVPQLARRAMCNGLSGLEHCSGIPGTLGGLVLMNGGSRRRAIGENVRRVRLVNPRGEICELATAECDFSYRHSNLAGRGIVVEVELECVRGEPEAIRREMVGDLRERRHKFPRKVPNCGSVFLSSPEMHVSVGPPGKLIEAAGLKGFRCGGAEISRQHANFILNRGNASSSDVLTLIAHIRRTLRRQLDFDLQCEVRYVSPAGEVRSAHLVAI